MAAKRKNGIILVTLRYEGKAGEGLASGTRTIHENGHILEKRAFGGWRQWAIVPIWGAGSVVEWMKTRGWVEVA